AVMIGTPFAILWFYRTTPGKMMMDRLALWFPVFGPLLRKIETVRVTRSLAALLEAGLDVGASLDLTSGVARLDPVRSGILNAKQDVLNGSELSASFRETRLFSPDVIAVMEAGEETGKLPESLEHLADEYEEQVEYAVRNLGQLIQPFLIIALGGLVLFIILAVLLPYISMLSSLAGG
ncbi:MAG: type II secretion system F family protein, partial [Isosphaeraceae bacterium]